MSQAPGRYAFSCIKGASFDKTLTWKQPKPGVKRPDPDDPKDWLPYDLTGYDGKLDIRQQLEDADPLVELTTANDPPDDPSITLGYTGEGNPVDLPNGVIRLFIPAVITGGTDLETVVKAVYDLKLEKTGESAIFLLEGDFVFELPVTR